MRNRCVEVCLLPTEAAVPPDPAQPQAQEDLLACLTTHGLPGRQLPEAMAAAHRAECRRLIGCVFHSQLPFQCPTGVQKCLKFSLTQEWKQHSENV